MTLQIIDGYYCGSFPIHYEHQYCCKSNNVLYEFNIVKARNFFDLCVPQIDGYGFSYSNQEILDHKYLIELHVVNGGCFAIKDTQINESSALPRSFKRYLSKFIKNIAFA